MNNRGKKIKSGSGSGSGSGDNRRMYDCDICKRGFTNPQALGGHRNLHRKERESNISSSYSSSNSHSSFPFSIPLPSSQPLFTNPSHNINPSPYFPIIESYQQQPPINPTYNTQRYAQGDEFLGLDLSLGLGSMNVVDDRRPPEIGGSQPGDDDDIDLDLRLGGHR